MGGLLLLCPLVVQAAVLQAPPGSDQELVRQLLARVERVETEVREPTAQQSDPVVAAKKPEPQMAMPAAAEVGDFPNIRFQGFADVGYGWSDASGDHNAFGLGQFNLFITSTLSNRLSVIAEPVFEADERNEFGVELERLLLQASAEPVLHAERRPLPHRDRLVQHRLPP